MAKWFCIVLGSLMIFVAVAGAPMAQPITMHVVFAARNAVDGLLQDGSVTVNVDAALLNHNHSDLSGRKKEYNAKEAVEMAVIEPTAKAVLQRTWYFGYVMFLMGCAWVAVGTRIGQLARKLREAQAATAIKTPSP